MEVQPDSWTSRQQLLSRQVLELQQSVVAEQYSPGFLQAQVLLLHSIEPQHSPL